MSGIRIENGPIGESPRSTLRIIFGDDDAISNLPTHHLANRLEADRIFFQTPQTEPRGIMFSGISLLSIIQDIPGIFAVEAMSAIKFMRRQSEIPNIEEPDYYRNPSFVARLTPRKEKPHPLDVWYAINRIIDAAYRPDALLSRVQISDEVKPHP